jgi:hypothetical protein
VFGELVPKEIGKCHVHKSYYTVICDSKILGMTQIAQNKGPRK